MAVLVIGARDKQGHFPHNEDGVKVAIEKL